MILIAVVRKNHWEQRVFRVTFSETEKVTDSQIIQETSCTYFDQDAKTATFRIKFKPAMKNGKPITVKKLIEYSFSIN